MLLLLLSFTSASVAEDGVAASAAEDEVAASAAEDGVAVSAAEDGVAAGDSPIVHCVSSFDEAGPVPAGHCWHDFATENGFNIGFDMKLPAGQHPSRPVDPEDEENARDH